MTHLKIEQNYDTTSLTSVEVVSSNVITKLYNLVLGGLDASSNLAGNLLVAKAYRNEVEYLTGVDELTQLKRFPNLNITVTGSYYIRFIDPEARRIFGSSSLSDGVGITESLAANIALNKSMVDAQDSVWMQFRLNTDVVDLSDFDVFQSNLLLPFYGMYHSALGMFGGCSNLESINLKYIKWISGPAFDNCIKLYNLGGVKPRKIWTERGGSSAFSNCASLTTIDLSECELLGDRAFSNCSNLTNITSLQNMFYLASSAFALCTSLQIDVNMPNYGDPSRYDQVNNDPLSHSGFYVALNNVYSVKNNSGVGYGAFFGSGIVSVSNLGYCAQIRDGASTLLYGNNIRYYNIGGFSQCPNLKYIILPQTLNFIGSYAFYGDTALDYIKCLATTPPTLNPIDSTSSSFPFYNTTCNIYVPDSANDDVLNAYKAADGWSAISSRIFNMSLFLIDAQSNNWTT